MVKARTGLWGEDETKAVFWTLYLEDTKYGEYQLTLLASLSPACYIDTLNESVRDQKVRKYM